MRFKRDGIRVWIDSSTVHGSGGFPQIGALPLARPTALVLSGAMEKEQETERRSRAWIVCRDAQMRAILVDLSRLALIRPMVVDADQRTGELRGVAPHDTLLVEAGCDVGEQLGDLSRVTISQPGSISEELADVLLPGDEVALLHLLSTRVSPPGINAVESASRVALVGAWNGGGGATTSAHRLARASRAVLLDAAGNRGGRIPVEHAASWESLDPDDLPTPWRLAASLPRLDGVPTLTYREGRPVNPGDPRVLAVTSLLERPVVVDCGVHVDALFDLQDRLEAAGKRVATILTGTADERGAASLGRWQAGSDRGGDVLYLVNGRALPSFHAVSQRYGIDWRRSPRAGSNRGWRKIRENVWA